MDGNYINILPPILAALSLCVAVVFGIYGFYDKKNERRRNFTIDLLGSFTLNSRIADSDFMMARRIRNNENFTGEDIDEETDRCVINLLDYYEFLSTAYFEGVLDEKVLFHIRGGAMDRAYDICEQYIINRRKIVDPNLYKNFQVFVQKYRDTKNGLKPASNLDKDLSMEAKIRQKYPNQSERALKTASLLLKENSAGDENFNEELFWRKLETEMKLSQPN